MFLIVKISKDSNIEPINQKLTCQFFYYKQIYLYRHLEIRSDVPMFGAYITAGKPTSSNCIQIARNSN